MVEPKEYSAKWYLGTIGFSYKDWAGPFYPKSLAQRNYLRHYSRFFNAVEIDSTFYGTPRAATVHRWLTVSSDHFCVCPKIPRAITHEKRLRSTHLEMAEFLGAVRGLEEKLGVILIQLPPSFGADQLDVLATFLGELPTDLRFAIEFRHPSWYQPQTEQLLRMHNVCWAATEYPDMPRAVILTADFIYFRLIGEHGQFDQHDCEQIDRSENLLWWYKQIQSKRESVSSVYGFFNNDYAGFGVESCSRFKSLAGLPVPSYQPPQQGRLF